MSSLRKRRQTLNKLLLHVWQTEFNSLELLDEDGARRGDLDGDLGRVVDAENAER